MTSPKEALARIWRVAGGDEAALARVALTGAEPALPSSFKVGTIAQATIAASALAASEVDRVRNRRAQAVTVDMRHAAAEFISERLYTVDGKPPGRRLGQDRRHLPDRRRALGAPAHELPAPSRRHPRHAQGRLHPRECRRGAEGVDRAAVRRRSCAARTRRHHDAQPRGVGGPSARRGGGGTAVAGDRAHRRRAAAAVAAGRAAAIRRARARSDARARGAGVRAHARRAWRRRVARDRAASPRHSRVSTSTPDAASCRHTSTCVATTARRRSPVSSRPRTSSSRAIVPAGSPSAGSRRSARAELRPGIVYVSLSAWGHVGPWSGRRGFDSLVQTASGVNHAEAEVAAARQTGRTACQALDHGAGYLMATGAMLALKRRAEIGGSWLVRLSLAQVGHWLTGLGRLPDGRAGATITRADVPHLLQSSCRPDMESYRRFDMPDSSPRRRRDGTVHRFRSAHMHPHGRSPERARCTCPSTARHW